MVFSTFNGKQYSGNPRAIYEYYVGKNKNKRYIWVLPKTNKMKVLGNPEIVRVHSISYLYHLATAQIWVMNANLDATIRKRKGQLFIQTWHGIPLKHIGRDAEIPDDNGKFSRSKSNWERDAMRWTKFISPGKAYDHLFLSAFPISKNSIIHMPYPRNRYLLTPQAENTERILEMQHMLHLPENKKVILYAPTYREGCFKTSIPFDIYKLYQFFGEQIVLLVKMHPHIKQVILPDEIPQDFCIDVSWYDDINDIFLVTDILITDYSSVFFDFSFLQRPMIFYPYDIEYYMKNQRSFYFDYEQIVPGPICYTSEVLLKQISSAL